MSAPLPASKGIETRRAIVLRLAEEVYNRRNVGAVLDLVAEDATRVVDHLAATVGILSGFPDAGVAVKSLTAEGDLLVGVFEIGPEGSPGGGTDPSAVILETFRIADDRIVDLWWMWTSADLLRRLRAASPGWPEPLLELEDIQGNVIPGFRKDHQAFVLASISNVQTAKRWLGAVQHRVASAREVLDFNRLFSAARRRRGEEGTVQATWLNVAFSFEGLRKLEPTAEQFVDEAFREGMDTRAAQLGEPSDPSVPGSPAQWVTGGPGAVPDMLIIVAGDDPAQVREQVSRVGAELEGAASVSSTFFGDSLPPPLTGHEHYGYLDGVSQPAVRGRVSDDPQDFITARMNPGDPNAGLPGEPLVWPGEFVFGYPRQRPDDRLRPGDIADGGPRWARNGSFLVFRRYCQDVEAFHRFLESGAEALAQQVPPLEGLTPEGLGAKLVGRWTSGAPVLRSPDEDNPSLGRDRCANNHFVYNAASPSFRARTPGQCTDDAFPPSKGDPEGLLCPHAAHARKSYPRDDIPATNPLELALTHRVIRRGIPYGPVGSPDAEKGLLFVSYQTSIERQFEFVVANWLNEPDYARAGAGIDAVVGQTPRQQPATVGIPVAAADSDEVLVAELELPADRWTTLTGGGYFFSPSLSALAALAG